MNGEIIYQYYDFNTFLSVIKNKELWFSDINKMNDYEEGQVVKNYLFQVIKFLKNSSEINKEKTEELIVEIIKIIINYEFTMDYRRYISCFSLNQDLLSQWRAYADDGNGITIGYNRDKLEKELKKCEKKYEFQLQKIQYLSKEINLEDKKIQTSKGIKKYLIEEKIGEISKLNILKDYFSSKDIKELLSEEKYNLF